MRIIKETNAQVFRVKVVYTYADGRTATSYQGPYTTLAAANNQAGHRRRVTRWDQGTKVVTVEVSDVSWRDA